MHRNLFWRTSDGFELDAGAYVIGLEYAAGVQAVVCGKPAAACFERPIVRRRGRTRRDGGRRRGERRRRRPRSRLLGILVRTGKFRETDLERGSPDHVVDSLADVPSLLGLAG
jgi:ribonucleotide monophosphatase NagD (HAD superfamily)